VTVIWHIWEKIMLMPISFCLFRIAIRILQDLQSSKRDIALQKYSLIGLHVKVR